MVCRLALGGAGAVYATLKLAFRAHLAEEKACPSRATVAVRISGAGWRGGDVTFRQA